MLAHGDQGQSPLRKTKTETLQIRKQLLKEIMVCAGVLVSGLLKNRWN